MIALQLLLFFFIILILIKPLGQYIYHIYQNPLFQLSIERKLYQICRIDPTREMDWKTYLYCLLLFNMIGIIFLYFLLRIQFHLPYNPEHFPNIAPDLSFNIAVSYVTNTNWQSYVGENTLSYFSQMAGLTVQNFLSAATGLSIFVALARGLSHRPNATLGNYWVDMTRGIIYLLFPLAIILAIILVSLGVIQNLDPAQHIYTLENKAQIIPMGPVASEVAISLLGSNGGGFFNANAAHPFQNPTFLTNWIEMLVILLIPASLCYTFGMFVKDRRQGWAIFSAMLLIFIPLCLISIFAEHHINPLINSLEIQSNVNLEGKETRFGIFGSALWSSLATATSNGSMNSMIDSYTPLGSLIPLWFMHLGEVIFGGLGSGMYGILMNIIIAAFIAGLMVGRSPEYLGKKIEPFEMKMACVAVLIMPLLALILTAIGSITLAGTASLGNPGPHGFSGILYAFTSMGNNNGSAFASLNSNTAFYNISGGIEMFLSRFWIAIPVLGIAGSMAKKSPSPKNEGTLRTHTPLFILFIITTIIIIGGLSFFPALALGPIVEHLNFWGYHGN